MRRTTRSGCGRSSSTTSPPSGSPRTCRTRLERERLPAALEAYEIRWAVALEPSSVFETRKLLEELRNRRRHEIGETKSGVEVGARDEADARALCDELGRLPTVGSISARKLGWLDRRQVREHLAGNYTGPPDPTEPGSW
jgi:hypothetical protein